MTDIPRIVPDAADRVGDAPEPPPDRLPLWIGISLMLASAGATLGLVLAVAWGNQ